MHTQRFHLDGDAVWMVVASPFLERLCGQTAAYTTAHAIYAAPIDPSDAAAGAATTAVVVVGIPACVAGDAGGHDIRPVGISSPL